MNTPSAEAKVQVRDYDDTRKAWSGWRDSLDFDPMTIPVEDQGADGTPLTTDVFNPTVIGAVDVLLEVDADVNREYRLVWSNLEHPVKGTCPVCDDVFGVGEGVPGDELNGGYDAVWCGCDPE